MKDKITTGEKYGPAMEITEQDAADAYFEECVQHSMRVLWRPRPEAEYLERQNIGYFAGYHSDETRARVERLFRCAHPVFGAIAARPTPTAEEAYEIGRKMALRDQKGQ